jgi:hypothetical protein
MGKRENQEKLRKVISREKIEKNPQICFTIFLHDNKKGLSILWITP